MQSFPLGLWASAPASASRPRSGESARFLPLFHLRRAALKRGATAALLGTGQKVQPVACPIAAGRAIPGTSSGPLAGSADAVPTEWRTIYGAGRVILAGATSPIAAETAVVGAGLLGLNTRDAGAISAECAIHRAHERILPGTADPIPTGRAIEWARLPVLVRTAEQVAAACTILRAYDRIFRKPAFPVATNPAVGRTAAGSFRASDTGAVPADHAVDRAAERVLPIRATPVTTTSAVDRAPCRALANSTNTVSAARAIRRTRERVLTCPTDSIATIATIESAGLATFEGPVADPIPADRAIVRAVYRVLSGRTASIPTVSAIRRTNRGVFARPADPIPTDPAIRRAAVRAFDVRAAESITAARAIPRAARRILSLSADAVTAEPAVHRAVSAILSQPAESVAANLAVERTGFRIFSGTANAIPAVPAVQRAVVEILTAVTGAIAAPAVPTGDHTLAGGTEPIRVAVVRAVRAPPGLVWIAASISAARAIGAPGRFARFADAVAASLRHAVTAPIGITRSAHAVAASDLGAVDAPALFSRPADAVATPRRAVATPGSFRPRTDTIAAAKLQTLRTSPLFTEFAARVPAVLWTIPAKRGLSAPANAVATPDRQALGTAALLSLDTAIVSARRAAIDRASARGLASSAPGVPAIPTVNQAVRDRFASLARTVAASGSRSASASPASRRDAARTTPTPRPETSFGATPASSRSDADPSVARQISSPAGADRAERCQHQYQELQHRRPCVP